MKLKGAYCLARSVVSYFWSKGWQIGYGFESTFRQSLLAEILWYIAQKLIHSVRCKAVGRSENPGMPVLFGGHNLPHLVEIGLTDLPKSGGHGTHRYDNAEHIKFPTFILNWFYTLYLHLTLIPFRSVVVSTFTCQASGESQVRIPQGDVRGLREDDLSWSEVCAGSTTVR